MTATEERARVLALCSVPMGRHEAQVNAERIDQGLSWRQMADRYGVRVAGKSRATLALCIRIARGDVPDRLDVADVSAQDWMRHVDLILNQPGITWTPLGPACEHRWSDKIGGPCEVCGVFSHEVLRKRP